MNWLQRIVRPRGLGLRLDLERRDTLRRHGERLRTTTLGAAGLRELEILACPPDLEDVTADLLLRLGEVALQEKPVRDGDAIGGALVDTGQSAIHMVTLRVVSESREPGSDEIFRVVDYGAPVTAHFPARSMATHLAALASRTGHAAQRERIFRRSIALFPGTAAVGDSRFAFDRGENLNNYVSWEGLGSSLIEQKKVAEGHEAFREAEARCPAWAADFRAYVLQQVAERPQLAADPALAYWIR